MAGLLNAYSPANPGLANRITGVVGEPVFSGQLRITWGGYQDFRLTAAQMDTLNATPVSLIAAPGAGIGILVTQIVTYVVAGSTAFELGSGTLDYRYTDGSGVTVATSVPNATVEATASTSVVYTSVGLAGVAVLNAPIVAFASADVTAGNGTIYGRIYYKMYNTATLIQAT